MTEEVKPQEGLENVVTPDQPQVSDIEQRALEMGWRPKEEFDGDEVDFIDAKEFVRRKPLFEKIEQQNRELKGVRKALDALKEHYGKVQETEYKRALHDLKEAQKKAMVDGDVEKYHELGEAKERIEQEAANFKQEHDAIEVQEPSAPHPQFAAWVNRNPWYQAAPHMRVFADQVGLKLAGQGYSPAEVLKLVEAEVRKEFPQKFNNPRKSEPGAVEGKRPAGQGKAASEKIELTEMETQIMNTLVRGGHITKEKYIADLKKAKGL